jgi:hypothetical protein
MTVVLNLVKLPLFTFKSSNRRGGYSEGNGVLQENLVFEWHPIKHPLLNILINDLTYIILKRFECQQPH